MDVLKSAGRCFLFSKCGCIPGNSTEKIFKRCFILHSEGSVTTWDYLKDKLGIKTKNTKRDIREQLDANYAEPETIQIPVNSNSRNEIWSPSYRGRTENKRF
ncbi:uncharacterized protein LOC131663600 [Phymastichus coffea]|uniref:uncharacterized protein LOC131663600 n=1 Tax=Phymastichus coffea TaxID=108790 RepID=UPI00273AAB15|nr:uncharacterized protein LOC131663600 [Phymastichus coffea]